MRLFTALEIASSDRQRIFNWVDRYLTLPTKQVAQTNYHITIAFFGDIKNENVEALVGKLNQLNEHAALNTFTLRLDQVAFWPKTGIIWIGPQTWPDALTKLAASHSSTGTLYGAKKSHRTYQPHISLARGASEMSAPLLQPEIDISVTHVTLYESQRTGGGRVEYHSLERWPL